MQGTESNESAGDAGGESVVCIETLEQALQWGASWMRAYVEERRQALRELRRLNRRIFDLEHALSAAENEAFILRTCLERGWRLDAEQQRRVA